MNSKQIARVIEILHDIKMLKGYMVLHSTLPIKPIKYVFGIIPIDCDFIRIPTEIIEEGIEKYITSLVKELKELGYEE